MAFFFFCPLSNLTANSSIEQFKPEYKKNNKKNSQDKFPLCEEYMTAYPLALAAALPLQHTLGTPHCGK